MQNICLAFVEILSFDYVALVKKCKRSAQKIIVKKISNLYQIINLNN